jgi:hypothetical protein
MKWLSQSVSRHTEGYTLVPLGDSYMRHAGPARRSRFTDTSAPQPQGQDRTNQRGPCRSTMTASPGFFKCALTLAREFTFARILSRSFFIASIPWTESSFYFRPFRFSGLSRAEFFGQRKTRLRAPRSALWRRGSRADYNLCE